MEFHGARSEKHPNNNYYTVLVQTREVRMFCGKVYEVSDGSNSFMYQIMMYSHLEK